LVHACARAAAAADDPRLKSACIGAVVCLMNASAATGSMIANVRWVSADGGLSALPLRLRVPRLPPLPKEEGGPHPPAFCKTTSGRFSSGISSLAGPPTRPVLRAKSKGGAPRGNRNAQKSGCHTAAFREFKRALALYVRTLKAQLALLRAMLPRARRRITYEIVTPRRCYVRTRRGACQYRAASPAANHPSLPERSSVKAAALPECLRHPTSSGDRSRRVRPRARWIDRRVFATGFRVSAVGHAREKCNAGRAASLRAAEQRSARWAALRRCGVHARQKLLHAKAQRCPR
jgi:hypothetical protein